MTPRLTANQVLGGYRVAELLGSGGMGEVYRAVHLATRREVAVKVIEQQEAGGTTGARFENEARIQASLAHPNIAGMHEYFEHRGLRCLVMELVPGETLASRLRRGGALRPADALAMLEPVAAAAAFMHARGIVHRDLTPSNIRIRPDGQVKVLDFGIARLEHLKGLTEAGQVIGTPGYLSPEQLRAGGATPQSDVWALGVLLFEMIAGRPPFSGRFPNEVARAIDAGAPGLTDIVTAGDPLHERVTPILARCLAVDPSRRFANAGELLDALRGSRTRPHPRTHHVVAATVVLLAALALLLRPDAAPTTRHRIDVAEGVADVRINGRERGRTPFDYDAARQETVSVELRQPGFQPLRETFVITERPNWTFSMRRTR